MADWDQRKKEAPDLNRATVLEKVKSNFHVGVLAYRDSELLAWILISPLIDTYWFWRRTASNLLLSADFIGRRPKN
jgi:hypothetical protein